MGLLGQRRHGLGRGRLPGAVRGCPLVLAVGRGRPERGGAEDARRAADPLCRRPGVPHADPRPGGEVHGPLAIDLVRAGRRPAAVPRAGGHEGPFHAAADHLPAGRQQLALHGEVPRTAAAVEDRRRQVGLVPQGAVRSQGGRQAQLQHALLLVAGDAGVSPRRLRGQVGRCQERGLSRLGHRHLRDRLPGRCGRDLLLQGLSGQARDQQRRPRPGVGPARRLRDEVRHGSGETLARQEGDLPRVLELRHLPAGHQAARQRGGDVCQQQRPGHAGDAGAGATGAGRHADPRLVGRRRGPDHDLGILPGHGQLDARPRAVAPPRAGPLQAAPRPDRGLLHQRRPGLRVEQGRPEHVHLDAVALEPRHRRRRDAR